MRQGIAWPATIPTIRAHRPPLMRPLPLRCERGTPRSEPGGPCTSPPMPRVVREAAPIGQNELPSLLLLGPATPHPRADRPYRPTSLGANLTTGGRPMQASLRTHRPRRATVADRHTSQLAFAARLTDDGDARKFRRKSQEMQKLVAVVVTAAPGGPSAPASGADSVACRGSARNGVFRETDVAACGRPPSRRGPEEAPAVSAAPGTVPGWKDNRTCAP